MARDGGLQTTGSSISVTNHTYTYNISSYTGSKKIFVAVNKDLVNTGCTVNMRVYKIYLEM